MLGRAVAGLLGHRCLTTLEAVRRSVGATAAAADGGPTTATTAAATVAPAGAAAAAGDPGCAAWEAAPGFADACRTQQQQQNQLPAVSVVPAGAVVWVVGLELLTRQVCGEDMSPLNKYR